MSTRSLIGKELPDGRVMFIYCHSDGYPSHNGKLLLEHYNGTQFIDPLLALGDISHLAEEIGEKHAFDYYETFYNKYKNGKDFGTDYDAMHADPEFQRLGKMVKAYGRDRGETGIEAKVVYNRVVYGRQDYGSEYKYLWDSKEMCWLWTTSNMTVWRNLTEKDCGE